VKAKTTGLPNTVIKEATVEFWFKPYNFDSIKYVFSMYGPNSSHEYFSIFKNENKNFICAPFGIDSVRSPYVIFSDLTLESIL